MSAALLIDGYKADHRRQYPEGTERVYSNFTARSGHHSNIPDSKGIVFFGLQYALKWLHEKYENEFFSRPKELTCRHYGQEMDLYLGTGAIPIEHIGALHDLGYLPIKVKGLKEGSFVNYQVPCLTITNTLPEFFWIVNYLETVLSSLLWMPCTSATTALAYRRIGKKYSDLTGAPDWFLDYQFHDFSFRGMAHPEVAIASGMAHLAVFKGTDTVPAIGAARKYYDAHLNIGGSVSATEHSVMCMGGEENELETFRRIITKLYPSGIVSIVSDSWDYWKVITEYALILKPEIVARDSKVIFRPDSGCPFKIICGNAEAEPGTPEYKGTVQCLWEIFGGSETENGFKQLEKVGVIYGDSITLELAERILENLHSKGFASSNVVFGVGSFSYCYVTRDSHGFAMKATWGIVNGEARELFKNPKTGSSKKSHKGLLRVENGTAFDQQTEEQEKLGGLKEVYVDGEFVSTITFDEIRANVRAII